MTVCNANTNLPEAHIFQNFIFSPLQMPRSAQGRPGRMPPSPRSHRHWFPSVSVCLFRIGRLKCLYSWSFCLLATRNCD